MDKWFISGAKMVETYAKFRAAGSGAFPAPPRWCRPAGLLAAGVGFDEGGHPVRSYGRLS
jgi:hypothetical protein